MARTALCRPRDWTRIAGCVGRIRAKAIVPCLVILLGMISVLPARAMDHVVAPDGRPAGAGTLADPWDLQTALSQPPSVRPGDVILLRGGVYRGGFTSGLRGSPRSRIVVRPFGREHVTIDCETADPRQSALFEVNGAWTDYRDFEITCTNPTRSTTITGSWPQDINRGGIDCHGSNCRFINLVVHDTSEGFGFWTEGEGGEIYGCLIYQNGWQAPDRGHGHAIYTQNRVGTKRLVDNILFEQFGYGIHAYGSSKAFLEGFDIEGNIGFNNGGPSDPLHLTPAIFVGGEAPARRVQVSSNFTYGFKGGDVLLGYPWGPGNESLTFQNNTVVGSLDVIEWSQLVAQQNTIVNPGALFSLDRRSRQPDLAIDHNRYYKIGVGPGFTLDGHPENWRSWRRSTGQDARSAFKRARPAGTWLSIRPNAYEPGRANIVVYNWDHRTSIPVDLSVVLHRGQSFRIMWAQDFFGEPVLTGIYHGGAINLPMTPRRAPPPIGMEAYRARPTLPEFGAFVLLPDIGP